MLLAIDAGNTNLTIGVFKGAQILSRWRLRTVHAPHRGRQGCRVLAADNPPEVIEGVVAALAGDFGVSERFIAVRLSRYGLVQGEQR